MAFRNTPHSSDFEKVAGRWVHQPLTNEHFGIQFSIQESGRIIIRSIPLTVPGTDEVEYEEVEIPASLIFKLAMLLKATRKFVPESDSKE